MDMRRPALPRIVVQSAPSVTSTKHVSTPPPSALAASADAAADRILPQQLGLIRASMPAALLGNVGIAATTVFVLWDTTDRTWLIVWIAVLALITAVRALVWLRVSPASLSPAEARRWRMRVVVGAGLAGVTWGALVLLSGATAPIEHQMFLGVVLAGMCAGAVAALSYIMPALYAFVLPALTPFIVLMLGTGGEVEIALGLMALLFFGCIIVIARSLERAVVTTFRLQQENFDLVERLTVAVEAIAAADAAKGELIEHLIASRREAESANQAKSMFLAIMSHELRTPLNAIIGFSDIIRSQAVGGRLDNPKYLEYVGDIRESGSHLLDLINKILDLSKIEAGKFDLAFEEVEIEPLVKSLLRLFREQATAAGLRIDVHVEPGAVRFIADERAVKQMLINLVSNALKFAPRGTPIKISARRLPTGEAELGVGDHGAGIAPDDIDKAVAPFSQLGDPLTRRHEGTGLGLSLVKSLIELHGGRLAIDSAIGTGTTVRLIFPREGALAAPVAAAS